MSDDRLPITEQRLTLADLARELAPDMTRSTIQRYDEAPGFARLMGKEGKGYPVSTLPLWKKIADARGQEPPLVRPETACIFLEGILSNPEQPITDYRLPINAPTESLMPLRGSDLCIVAEIVGAAIRHASENSTSALMPLMERLVNALEGQTVQDRAVPKAEAALLMGVAESSVNRHIPALTTGHVSHQHIQEWLAARRAQAEQRRANRKVNP